MEFKKQNKGAKGNKERDKPRKRLLSRESKLMVCPRGEGGRVMGEIGLGDQGAHLAWQALGNV